MGHLEKSHGTHRELLSWKHVSASFARKCTCSAKHTYAHFEDLSGMGVQIQSHADIMFV